MRTSRSPICVAPSAFPFSNNLQPSRTMNPRHLLPPLLAAAVAWPAGLAWRTLGQWPHGALRLLASLPMLAALAWGGMAWGWMFWWW